MSNFAEAAKASETAMVAHIKNIVSDCEKDPEGKVQPVFAEVIAVLKENGFAKEEIVKPMNVHVHPANRQYTGVDPVRVHELISRIGQAGFSELNLEQPTFFEKLDGAWGLQQESFILKHIMDSYGLLSLVDTSDTNKLSVTCSHTLCACNVVDSGGSLTNDDTASLKKDGYLSRELALQKYPTFRKPIEEGVTATVIKKKAEQLMPFLPDFLSRAGNQKHGIHREESKVQLMLAIARVFAMQSKSKDGASWQDVVRKVESMKPHHAGKCSELGEYVKKYSGGDGSPLLIELDVFAKCLHEKRDIHPGQIGMVARTNMVETPLFPGGMIKFLMTTPSAIYGW